MRRFSLLSRKTLYVMTLAMLFMTAAGFYMLAPATTTVVEAQKAGSALITSDLTPRPDRLAIALDFRSAHGLSVFGGGGMNVGNSTFRGALPDATTKNKAGQDLDRAHTIVGHLPCTTINDSDLTGKAIAPGVYCLSSVRLAGQLTLDGIGDPNATYVFRVKGDINAEPGSSFTLQNGALPQNVYFVADGKATVADGIVFGGTILSRGDITVGGGSDVKGRLWSVDGKVTTTGESVAGGGTGILEICKEEQPTPDGVFGLGNRIFRFQIGANIYLVQTGFCSGPIELPVGNVLITELNDGPLVPSGSWSGRFKLVDVFTNPAGALGAVNRPARTAVVFIREGDISNMTVATFLNAFAIVGHVEICKRALDIDVVGFFDYNIDAIANFTQTVPVGFCSPSIAVLARTFPQPVPPPPGRGLMLVTEISEPGFQFEVATTFPADRLASSNPNIGINNSIACSNIGPFAIPAACIYSNPGGGVADMVLVEGGVELQTTVNFFNRSRPGRVKICKVAGPGIPVGTIFRYRVRGTGPSNPFPGPQLPGVPVDTTVDVSAGPANQGGFCSFVDALFIIGTTVTTNELGWLTPIPGVPPADVRVSRIRFMGVVANLTQAQLQSLSPPPAGTSASLQFTARREIVEIEYTNHTFRPTALKICKEAGTGVALGTPFTFTVVIDDEGGLFAPASSIAVANVVVQAGFCAFAQGPYRPFIFTNPDVGAFRVGSRVYVTEAAAAGTVLTSISSPTGAVIACNPANARCGGLVMAHPGGFNEIIFRNQAAAVQRPAPFDFDGDGRTDISVTRPSGSSTWYQLVGQNYDFVQFNLGQNGDVIVPADYDGDGKTQAGVFRPSTGDWWVMSDGDTVENAVNAGAAGDIPLPSDYTGDGKADFVLFRPSTSQWLRYENGSTATSHFTFGTTGDKPLVGDFDGDGKADLAVFRPSTGTFWYAASSAGNAFRPTQWGTSGDVPAVADFDGDGKTDYAVFRPSTGIWYIMNSSNGSTTGLQWGTAGDRPLAGDFDGDGRADVAVFRPSNGTWYIIKSGSGYLGFAWGISTDIATPSVYVP